MLERLKDVKFWGAVALLLSTMLFAFAKPEGVTIEAVAQFVAGVASLLLGIKMPQSPPPSLPPSA